LPHLTFSPGLAAPHPHTPKRGGGEAEAVPNLPNLCRTSSAAGAAEADKPVPLARFLDLKSRLREEHRLRVQAENDRDALKTTLSNVLEGLKNGG
jgi:hypothetical protein